MEEEFISHYGVKRRSGRYPWGSGENPYQGDVKKKSKTVQKLERRILNEKGEMSFRNLNLSEMRKINKTVEKVWGRSIEGLKRDETVKNFAYQEAVRQAKSKKFGQIMYVPTALLSGAYAHLLGARDVANNSIYLNAKKYGSDAVNAVLRDPKGKHELISAALKSPGAIGSGLEAGSIFGTIGGNVAALVYGKLYEKTNPEYLRAIEEMHKAAQKSKETE